MTDIFLRILSLSLASSPIILAVVAVRFLFKRAPKWLVCVMWAFVALRLVLPALPETNFSLVPQKAKNVESVFESLTDKQSEYTYVYEGEEAYNEKIESGVTPSTDDNGQKYVPVESVSNLSEEKESVIIPVISYIWAFGVAVLLIGAIISYLKLKKSVSVSLRLKDNIRVCDDIPSPFLLGVFRPVIYVPSSLSGEALDCVIDHEKAHIKRHDNLWKPIAYLLLTIYWFNPLCWLAYILLCRDIEAACDEKVIKNLDDNERALYSQTLLDFSFPRKQISACPVAFGETGVKARIKSVLSYKKPTFWVILIAVVVCAVVAVCFGTNPKTAALTNGLFYAAGNDIMKPYIDISAEDKTITLGASVYASYADHFTYEETKNGIVIYDSEGNITTHTIEAQPEGVIFDGTGYIFSNDVISEAISKVLLEECEKYSGECHTEGHIILGKELNGDIVKVYLLTNLNSFCFEDGYFVDAGGSSVPRVMTFKFSNREYVLTRAECAEDGEGYGASIKKIFPKKYQSRVLNPREHDANDMWLQCKEQARTYLDEIGRTAIICRWSSLEHTTFTEAGMPVGISNRFEDILGWENYHDYIGYKEVIEEGRRYIYRTVFEALSNTLVFTKEDVFADNDIVKKARVNIKTGEVLTDGLRSVYPEYYDLPTDKGLNVFVWKNSDDIYKFGLLPNKFNLESDEESIAALIGLKAASQSSMQEILSSYDIDDKDVNVIAINHPLSSYLWDYEKEFSESEKSRVKGCLLTPANSVIKEMPGEDYRYLTGKFFGEEYKNDDYSDFNMAQQFLTCTYDDVRDIDFSSVFYIGLPNKELSKREYDILSDKYGDVCPFSKIPAGEMNEVLKKYTGLSSQETNKNNLDKLIYLSEFDTYYNQHGDTNHITPVFCGGHMSDDLFVLLYDNGKSFVTLRKTREGDYQIVRNNKYQQPRQVPATIEGEVKPFDFETKSELKFDFDKDLLPENWTMFCAKVKDGYVIEIESVSLGSVRYHNDFFFKTDNVILTEGSSKLYVSAIENSKESKYEIITADKNLVLKKARTGELVPYYGDQKTVNVNQ